MPETSVRTLPPLPDALIGRSLTNEQFAWLQNKYGNALSKGPDDCPTCKGNKTFVHAGDGHTYECDCAGQWMLHMLFAHAGIDKRYQQYSWADTESVDPEALALAKDYVKWASGFIDRGLGIIFHGKETGTGKTLLTTLIVKSVIAQGHSAVFVRNNDLLDMYGDTFSDKDERQRFDNRVRYVDLLAIDDIGREHLNRSAMADSALDSLLRCRVAGMRPTIVTSNLDLAGDALAVSSRYSENIVSLLRECSIMRPVVGSDYREKSQQAAFNEVLANPASTRPIVVA